MPVFMFLYLLFVIVGGIFAMYYYRNRGSWFLVGESFSLLFTLMLFLYHYELYPKPDSVLVPVGMFFYILYWELVENKELIVEELKKEQMSKEESMLMIALFVAMLSPLFYVSGMLFSSYY